MAHNCRPARERFPPFFSIPSLPHLLIADINIGQRRSNGAAQKKKKEWKIHNKAFSL